MVLGLFLGLGGTGCEGGPPPPEPVDDLLGDLMDNEALPRTDGARLSLTVPVTFTRDEAPVQVNRDVQVALDADANAWSGEILRAALTALLAGPTPEEEERGTHSFFSAETVDLLDSVRMEADTAVVSFTGLPERIPNAASSAGSRALLIELNGTAFGVGSVEAVRWELDGSCAAFWAFLQRDCQLVERGDVSPVRNTP